MSMKLICQHCGYEWEYGGQSEHYATCPRCQYKVPVKTKEGKGE